MITLAETASYTVTVYCMYMHICNGNCNLYKCHQSYSDTESAGFPCLIRENFTLEGEHEPAKQQPKLIFPGKRCFELSDCTDAVEASDFRA